MSPAEFSLLVDTFSRNSNEEQLKYSFEDKLFKRFAKPHLLLVSHFRKDVITGCASHTTAVIEFFLGSGTFDKQVKRLRKAYGIMKDYSTVKKWESRIKSEENPTLSDLWGRQKRRIILETTLNRFEKIAE